MHAAPLLSATGLILLTQITSTHARPAFPPIFNWFQQTTPTLPPSSLPAPTGTLQYIALGLGTQNYTCSSATATPVAAGALANLYDVTAVLSTQGWIGQTATQQMPCFADSQDSSFGMRQIGVHYFNGAGVPNFDLTMAGQGQYLEAVKMATASAPSGACTGRSGDPAVAWLFLQQDGSGRSSGLTSVYRVETAGGSALSCDGVQNGWVTRDYAAEYWFYE